MYHAWGTQTAYEISTKEKKKKDPECKIPLLRSYRRRKHNIKMAKT